MLSYFNECPICLQVKHIVLSGIDQACLLTKSVRINGLPNKIQDLFQKYSIPSQVSALLFSFIYHKRICFS